MVKRAGRKDMTPFEVEGIFNQALEVAGTGVVKKPLEFVGVRE